MRTFFLFWLLAWLLGSPLLAGLVLLALFAGSYLLYSRRLFALRRRWRERVLARRLEAVLAVNPADAKAHSDLGGLLARRGRFADALQHLEQAIGRSEDIPDTNFFLGWTLLELGDLERGRRHLQTALALNPRFGFGEPHLRLANYFFERRAWGEAIPPYEASREMHGSGMEAAWKLGECYLALGEREQAARVLEPALATYRALPWFRRQEERPWARRARAALRRAQKR